MKNKRLQGLRKKQALDSKTGNKDSRDERERREVLTSSESFDETSSSSPKVLKHIFSRASLHLLAKHRRWECTERNQQKKKSSQRSVFYFIFPSLSAKLCILDSERERKRDYILWEREERRENPRNEKGKTIRGSAMLYVSD